MKNTREHELLQVVVNHLSASLSTPKSQAVLMTLKGDHEALLSLGATANGYQTAAEFAKDYFITEYLSKYKGLDTSYDKPAVALGKWKLAETQCSVTNARFRNLKLNFNSAVEPILHRAQRKIFKVLGGFTLRKVLSDCRWGPGATYDMSRVAASRDKKISKPLTVTPKALRFIRLLMESDPNWGEAILGYKPVAPFSLLPECFVCVRGSRFLTVPKNAKTDRCIAAEPTGNSFLQQGVGRFIRRRLKAFGVDLDDQSRNQEFAREALKLGLATIDLSSASDTIATELVFHLLPLDWAHYLDAIRSPETFVKGEWIRTEKFASMGNGFCFELESLLFWALMSSMEEDSGRVDLVSVYGDDIIVPVDLYETAEVVLSFVGFTLNPEKSHATGLFRESCGKHFFNGVDVTPVYQKECLTHPSELIRAYNRLFRLFRRMSWPWPRKALRAFQDFYPLKPLPLIPYPVEGDDGFLDDESKFVADPVYGYRCRVLVYSEQYKGCNEAAMLQDRLRTIGRQFDRRSFANPLPSGHCAVSSQSGRWRTRVRYIQVAAVRGFPASDWLPV